MGYLFQSQSYLLQSLDLLEDGRGHVLAFVAGAIEVGLKGIVQVGPRLPVRPRHADPRVMRHRFTYTVVVLSSSQFLSQRH